MIAKILMLVGVATVFAVTKTTAAIPDQQFYQCASGGFVALTTDAEKHAYCSRNTTAVVPCDYLRCTWYQNFYMPLAYRCPENVGLDTPNCAASTYRYNSARNVCELDTSTPPKDCYTINLV